MKHLTSFVLLISVYVFTVAQTVYSVFIPNLFTPNNDGNNDVFKVYGSNIVSLDLRIYNRWGEIVYQSNDTQEILEIGWDGKFNNKEQPAGTYLWKVNGKFDNGDDVTANGQQSGSLLLVR